MLRTEAVDDSEKYRTVFVGNLPTSIVKKKLKSCFSQCGEIESVRIRGGVSSEKHLPKKAAVITNTFSEYVTSLIGYIKFKSTDAVEKALELNGTMIGGNRIRVDDLSEDNKKVDSKRSVFVGNMPFDISDNIIFDHFKDCGVVDDVRLVRDNYSGLGKGFGFVTFQDQTSVSLALKLNNQKCKGTKGRELRVTRVAKKQKLEKVENNRKQKVKGGQLSKEKAKKFTFRGKSNNTDNNTSQSGFKMGRKMKAVKKRIKRTKHKSLLS